MANPKDLASGLLLKLGLLLDREATRSFFHWSHSGVLIPLFVSLALGAISLNTESVWTFVLAYIFWSSAFLWTLGWWLTSDTLRKMNPRKLGRSRRKRVTKRDYVKFRIIKFGILGFFTVIFLLAIYVTRSIKVEKELTSLHGWLIPANDATVRDSCGGGSDKTVALYLGSNVVGYVDKDLKILTIRNKPLIKIERNPKGHIALTMDVYNDEYKLVAQIVKNEFKVNRNRIFEINRKDQSSLIVVAERLKEELFNVRYLNPNAIQIRGRFNYPGVPTIKIDEKGTLYIGDQFAFNNGCLMRPTESIFEFS